MGSKGSVSAIGATAATDDSVELLRIADDLGLLGR
jgi:hypothetical protein